MSEGEEENRTQNTTNNRLLNQVFEYMALLIYMYIWIQLNELRTTTGKLIYRRPASP